MPFNMHGFEAEGTDFDELLRICHPQKVLRWEERFAKDAFAKAVKIGEGSYGEVFKVKLDGHSCIIKVIPFRDEQFPSYDGQVNGEHLNYTAQMLPEVITTTELCKLRDCPEGSEGFMAPGFVRLHGISVVQGKYPAKLTAAWDRYAKLKNGSENDRPADYATDDQLFLVFAMAEGGPDLEKVKLKTQQAALSVFVQVALSLAVAEERLRCEHRDLHEGNILVDRTPVDETIRFDFNGKEMHVKTHGVKATIIDFTLSRISKDGSTVFTDLAKDKELFGGQGSYQFDIYRMMRDHNNDDWETFRPRTNLFWLHYLSEKLLEKLKEAQRSKLRPVFEELLKVDRIRDFLLGDTFHPYFKKVVRNTRLDENAPNVYIVEKILGVRWNNDKKEYYIKWRHYDDPDDNTWEAEEGLDCPDAVKKFEAEQQQKGVAEPADDLDSMIELIKKAEKSGSPETRGLLADLKKVLRTKVSKRNGHSDDKVRSAA